MVAIATKKSTTVETFQSLDEVFSFFSSHSSRSSMRMLKDLYLAKYSKANAKDVVKTDHYKATLSKWLNNLTKANVPTGKVHTLFKNEVMFKAVKKATNLNINALVPPGGQSGGKCLTLCASKEASASNTKEASVSNAKTGVCASNAITSVCALNPLMYDVEVIANNLEQETDLSILEKLEPSSEQKDLILYILKQNKDVVKGLIDKFYNVSSGGKKTRKGGTSPDNGQKPDNVNVTEITTTLETQDKTYKKTILWCMLGMLFFSTIFNYMGMFTVLGYIYGNRVGKSPIHEPSNANFGKVNFDDFNPFTLQLLRYTQTENVTEVQFAPGMITYEAPISKPNHPKDPSNKDPSNNFEKFLKNPSVVMNYVLPTLNFTTDDDFNTMFVLLEKVGDTAFSRQNVTEYFYNKVMKVVPDAQDNQDNQPPINGTISINTTNTNTTAKNGLLENVKSMFGIGIGTQIEMQVEYDKTVWYHLNNIAFKMNEEMSSRLEYNVEMIDRIKDAFLAHVFRAYKQRGPVKEDEEFKKQINLFKYDMHIHKYMLTKKNSEIAKCLGNANTAAAGQCLLNANIFESDGIYTKQNLDTFVENQHFFTNLGLGMKKTTKVSLENLLKINEKVVPIQNKIAYNGVVNLSNKIRFKLINAISSAKFSQSEQVVLNNFKIISGISGFSSFIMPIVDTFLSASNPLSIALATTQNPTTALVIQGLLKASEFAFKQIQENVLTTVVETMPNVLDAIKAEFETEIERTKRILPKSKFDLLINLGTSFVSQPFSQDTMQTLLATSFDEVYMEPLSDTVLLSLLIDIIDIVNVNINGNGNRNVHSTTNIMNSIKDKKTNLLVKLVFLITKNGVDSKVFAGGRKRPKSSKTKAVVSKNKSSNHTARQVSGKKQGTLVKNKA
uniref:Uncharacterized protein n=1 Tax=Pyramimonas orientalis virus TaxID=455367 RepID=A0A7M3UP60_POV01|nr:hypothetical protein HWQ62_00390 [Pyramimonas orientalis virus]